MTQLKARLGRLEQQCESSDDEIILIGNIMMTRHAFRRILKDIAKQSPPELHPVVPAETDADRERKAKEKRDDLDRTSYVIRKVSEFEKILGNRARVFVDEFGAWLTRVNLREMQDMISNWSASAESQQASANG